MRKIKEIWVPCQYIRKDGTIEAFDGYEVSNLGRVKSLNYNRTKKDKVLKFNLIKKKHGTYHMVYVCKNGRAFNRLVHRLVLSSFNPTGYFPKAVVDHINSVPGDDRLENLRWVTQRKNIDTPHCRAAKSKTISWTKNRKDLSKRVRVTFPDGHVEIFPSANEADRALCLPMRTVSSYIINYHKGYYKKKNLFFEYIRK